MTDSAVVDPADKEKDKAPKSGRPPLPPQVTEQNRFFWTAGADGTLRIQECESCSALIHPPQPVCRYCRGHRMGVREVSGTATLAGFTVNHRFGLPPACRHPTWWRRSQSTRIPPASA